MITTLFSTLQNLIQEINIFQHIVSSFAVRENNMNISYYFYGLSERSLPRIIIELDWKSFRWIVLFFPCKSNYQYTDDVVFSYLTEQWYAYLSVFPEVGDNNIFHLKVWWFLSWLKNRGYQNFNYIQTGIVN